MWLFYALALLVLLQSVVSLVGGWRYLAYVRREAEAKRALYMPFASVIAPCRGLEPGLFWNVGALFRQHYPRYEIIFVFDSPEDPALAVVEEAARCYAEQGVARARTVVAGRARDCGQKVHNLRAGVEACDPASEVFVFVDTDARPRPDWLRSLVAPLSDEGVGAATGYRWFLPSRGKLAAQLRSVWNASAASALGARTGSNFCWGGSTAIRRETFLRAGVPDEWRGALSDDLAITRALQRQRLPIHFVPDCLVASHDDCTFAELVEFTTRQLKVTRVYAPRLWKIVLVSNLLWSLAFYGGLALSIARAAAGLSFEWPLALVAALYTLGVWKAFFRLRAVALTLADDYAPQLRAGAAAQLFLWPLTALLYLYNAVAAGLSRRLTWRGITYELKSPRETVIISGVPAETSEPRDLPHEPAREAAAELPGEPTRHAS